MKGTNQYQQHEVHLGPVQSKNIRGQFSRGV